MRQVSLDDHSKNHGPRLPRRRGLSLTELMISLVLLAMLVGGAASLTQAGRMATEQSRRWDAQTQTSRVALRRICDSVASAFGSNEFPAVVVFPTLHTGSYVPDTLVVWQPLNGATPQNPQGLPTTDELVFYFPDPADPRRLIESRLNYSSLLAPPLSDTVGWTSLVGDAKTEATADWVEINRHLRTAQVATGVTRAVVHFHMTYAPTDAEFSDYSAALVAWDELAWPLGRVSAEAGYRVAVCQIELQVALPGAVTAFYVNSSATASFAVQP